jgi:S-(hydroxymethyl)glutathione dehydrogenase/alcohol dehydrogenase
MLAKEFGATHVIHALRQDPLEVISELTDNKGVDYCVEASGNKKTIETAFRSVRKFGGLCIFASHPRLGVKIELDPYDLICGRIIEGSWGGGSRPDEDIPRLASLYREGRLPLEKFISQTYTLENINQALDDLENRKIVRALISFI